MESNQQRSKDEDNRQRDLDGKMVNAYSFTTVRAREGRWPRGFWATSRLA